MSDETNMVIGGPPNYARDGLCSISAGATWATDHPKENLFTPEPSHFARVETLNPEQYFFVNLATALLARSRAGMLGLVDIGVRRPPIYLARVLGQPIARMRMCVSNNGAFAHLDGQAVPTSLPAVTGFVGSAGNIDEDPYSPDANKLAWSGSGTPDAATIGFNWTGTGPNVGPHNQMFIVRLAGVGAGTVRVTLSLYESGSVVAAVPSRTVFIPAGKELIVLYTWDSTHLATASGANVQLRIQTNSNATVGCDVRSVRWRGVKLNASAPPDFDTGWVDLLEANGAYLGDEVGDIDDPTVTRLSVLPEAIRSAGWSFCAFAWQIEAGYVGKEFTPPYLDIGAAAVLPILRPTVNFDASGTLGVEDRSTSGATMGGQWYGAKRRPRRVAEVTLPGLTREEAAALYRRLDFGSGTSGPFAVSLWPDVTDPRHYLGQFYATLRDTDGMGLRPAPDRMQRRLSVIEKV